MAKTQRIESFDQGLMKLGKICETFNYPNFENLISVKIFIKLIFMRQYDAKPVKTFKLCLQIARFALFFWIFTLASSLPLLSSSSSNPATLLAFIKNYFYFQVTSGKRPASPPCCCSQFISRPSASIFQICRQKSEKNANGDQLEARSGQKSGRVSSSLIHAHFPTIFFKFNFQFAGFSRLQSTKNI